MSYTKVLIHVSPLSPGREIVMAFLAEAGFESFMDFDTGVEAYIRSEEFNEKDMVERLASTEVETSYTVERLADQNWNEVWESEYETVFLSEDCVIRAPFHNPMPEFRYELIIEPRMSFGTGHHQTTTLMAKSLLGKDLSGKTILDVGTGTGVLAILAEKLGAVDILATDIEDYILENARQNIQHNSCVHIDVEKADSQTLGSTEFDITLANINLNALLHELKGLCCSVKRGGSLILSGFYEPDAKKLVQEAGKWGFRFAEMNTIDHWTALELKRE